MSGTGTERVKENRRVRGTSRWRTARGSCRGGRRPRRRPGPRAGAGAATPAQGPAPPAGTPRPARGSRSATANFSCRKPL